MLPDGHDLGRRYSQGFMSVLESNEGRKRAPAEAGQTAPPTNRHITASAETRALLIGRSNDNGMLEADWLTAASTMPVATGTTDRPAFIALTARRAIATAVAKDPLVSTDRVDRSLVAEDVDLDALVENTFLSRDRVVGNVDLLLLA